MATSNDLTVWEISQYKIVNQQGMPVNHNGYDVTMMGIIQLYGSGGKHTIYFLKDGDPMPHSGVGVEPTRVRSRAYAEYKDMPIYVDMLRNEKPVYVFAYDDANFVTIQTGREPIGEDEVDD